VEFVNQKWTNSDVGFQPFGYVEFLHLTGGEVTNCKKVGGGTAFDLRYKDVKFEGNGSDISIAGMRLNTKTDVAELWVDGERRHRGNWVPTVITTKLTGAKEVELRLFRDGKLVSSHSRKLDSQGASRLSSALGR
jgi:hypothetical protein